MPDIKSQMRLAYSRDRRDDEAIESFQESLRLDPEYVPALTAFGWALQERGDLDEAMAMLRKSIELKPDPLTHSNVLMTINYHPGYSPADLFEAHKSWAEQHEKPLREYWPKHKNDRSPDRRIRVGYMSPDMREHSVKFFFEPILANHDHEQIEVFAYAHLRSVDMNTWRMRTKIDQWCETSGMTPTEVVTQIHKDQIDILVDLAGHTANNSLHIFALKPAPIQVNMIGFPSTTGLSAMDYRITDARCDPPGETDQYNTETLVRLPDIFWCFQPEDRSPPVGPLPADANGFVTFTSVNNLTKITPAVQSAWAKILAAVPNSKLIMQTTAVNSPQTQEKIRARFAKFNVAPERIDFRKPTDLLKYLQLLNESDMTFDPFPFNGGTTTCHSLWMGAPVISLAGKTHAARMGYSMLSCIGLPELCAKDEAGYVDLAVKLASDLPRLRDIRKGMRQRMQNSPLLDGVKYTRNLEAAFRKMWRTWCETGQ